MKVYEVMKELSKAPAGAEVEVSKLMTLIEFTESEIVDDIEGEDNYRISGNITSACVNTDYVTLYFD